MSTVWFVILLAWTPAGSATSDSGVFAAPTLAGCHIKSLRFAKLHETVIKLCREIPSKHYAILASGLVVFDHSDKPMPEVEPYIDPEVARLRKALLQIGKWHRGKTKDSQRVRAIIKKVMQ